MYSNIDMISSLCILMARGAIISMFVVIFILPSMFMIFDKLICATSMGFRNKKGHDGECVGKQCIGTVTGKEGKNHEITRVKIKNSKIDMQFALLPESWSLRLLQQVPPSTA